MAIIQKIKKVWSLPVQAKFLVWKVFCLSAVVRLLLLILPFKSILGFLSKRNPSSLKEDEIQTRFIGYYVEKVCDHTPWKSTCLVKAIVGKYLLQNKKLESIVNLGVAKNKKDELKAHAWLQSQGKVLTGYQEMKDYTVIATF